MYRQQPSLTQLADGDLVQRVDFCSLYAAAARRFIGVKTDSFGRTYSLLDFLA